MQKQHVGATNYVARQADDDSNIKDEATLGEWLEVECGYEDPTQALLVPCSIPGKRDWFEVTHAVNGKVCKFHCKSNAKGTHTHATVMEAGLTQRLVWTETANGMWWFTADRPTNKVERGEAFSFSQNVGDPII